MIIGNGTGTRGDSADAPWSSSVVDVRTAARRRPGPRPLLPRAALARSRPAALAANAQPLLIEDGPEFGASNFGDQELRVLVTAKVDGTFMRWSSVVKPVLRLVYFAPARDTDFPDCNWAPKGRGGVAA